MTGTTTKIQPSNDVEGSTTQPYTYSCYYFDHKPVEEDWTNLPQCELVDVATGEAPRLKTTVQACWTDDALHMRFTCEDDHMYSPFQTRDEPLYEADVVEWFIDIEGSGQQYYEFNLSPDNVVFDALIRNMPGQERELLPSWNADGLNTSVEVLDNANSHSRASTCDTESCKATAHEWYRYDIELPFADLNAVPRDGSEWRMNCFRIDAGEGQSNNRSYWAWSPTGAVNFHVPERFGRIQFETRRIL